MSQPTAYARLTPRPVRRAPLAPLRVVPTAIQQTGNGLFAGICMVLLGAGLVTLLMLNIALAQGSSDLKTLQAKSGVLADTQEQLTQVIDDQRSPRNLAARAQQMGMVPAKSMAFIKLSDGSIIGVAEPADANQRLNVITTPVAPPPAPVTPAAKPGTPAAKPGTPATKPAR